MKTTAQTTTVTVRFANPEYNVTTQTYKLDVEFQSDTPNEKLYGMNVRFFYDENVLEFESFGEFEPGYGPIDPDPPIINTMSASSGPVLFGFTGPAEYVNGAIQLLSTTNTYLSTAGWTKLFNITFHVDDTTAANGDFCPSVVWDLEEDPANGGFFTGSAGVVITVVAPPPNTSSPAFENVQQFNWDYDGIPGYPFGLPEEIYCVSSRVAPTTKIRSTLANANGYVTFPFTVHNFVDISSFSLTIDYDTAVLQYCCAVPNDAIAVNFDTNLVFNGRIQMLSDGFDTCLADETVLFYATFEYLGGASDILWCDDGASCQYIDANTSLPLADEPTSSYYYEGNVSPGQFVWLGSTSSQWDDATNWQDGLIPDGFDSATVNSNPIPANWPTFSGDFVMGSHCKDLTLNGEAEITITGDLTINPGSVLTIADTGEVIIGGDWTNSGIFNPGLGEVTFIGSGNGSIGSGAPPANFIAGYTCSTFAHGLTFLTDGLPGPTDDEGHSDVPIGFNFTFLGTDYSQARISTNGWITLNLTGEDSLALDNNLLFGTSGPTTVIAPWWDDLKANDLAAISYKTEGSEPNRIFTAEWKNIKAFHVLCTTKINFQVKLFESTNIIEFHYGDVTPGTHNIEEGASIGIKGTTGGPGDFMEATYGTTNMMVGCLLSNEDWPTVNYRFTPPQANNMETFHHLNVNKDSGELLITQDVTVTGTE